MSQRAHLPHRPPQGPVPALLCPQEIRTATRVRTWVLARVLVLVGALDAACAGAVAELRLKTTRKNEDRAEFC